MPWSLRFRKVYAEGPDRLPDYLDHVNDESRNVQANGRECGDMKTYFLRFIFILCVCRTTLRLAVTDA
jgi:hypothetical protein